MGKKRVKGWHWSWILCGMLLWWGLPGEPPSLSDSRFRLNALSGGLAFDFLTWELRALGQKLAYDLLAPQRWMDEESRARFVLAYLDQVKDAQALDAKIQRAYTDPAVSDPARETADLRERRAALRLQLGQQAPIAEAILEEQGSLILKEVGLTWDGLALPPIQGTFTPLPYLLVVSPREKIESYYQRPLWPGLDTAEQEGMEQRVEQQLGDYSALTTPIGGLAAYPAMLQESDSIDWTAEVFIHEWVHHALFVSPLGLSYELSPEARIINETAASVVGEWGGQALVQRFYAPLLARPKPLPDPLGQQPVNSAARTAAFDYWGEMHRTRVTADRLLKEGKIREAELYMEAQRRYFLSQGYRIRRLNQAYFAFYGAYASRPGAAGGDPLGPAVRRLWGASATPQEFLAQISQMTGRADLQRSGFLPGP